MMSSKRGRNRNSGAVSDRRSDDSKGSPEKSESSSPEVPLSYEYETEDGLKIEISPESASISREYELSESDYLEFSAEVDWDVIDIDIERDGRGTDISGSVELPGDVLGLGGGVEVDLATGEVTGGEISAEVGTVGLDVEVSDRGCEVSIGISLMGFGATYTKDVCNDEEEEKEEDDGEEGKKGEELGAPGGELDDWGDFAEGLPPGCSLAVAYAGWVLFDKRGTFLSRKKQGGGFFGEAQPTGWIIGDNGGKVPGRGIPWLTSSYNLASYRIDLPGPGLELYSECAVGGAHSVKKWLHPDRPYSYVGSKIDCQFFPNARAHPRRDPANNPPPGKPPMRTNKCCNDSTKMIREVHKALAVRELLENNLVVPNRLVAPNAKGLAKLKSYLEISQWQIRMADHLGIHPFKASISDGNAAQAGNQEVKAQFVSGTAALNKVVELLLENKGDAAVRLNLLVRISVILTQIIKVATISSKSLNSLISFIGMPIQEMSSNIKMPFDVSLGARRKAEEKKSKGFDPRKKDQEVVEEIKINTEAATEEVLPDFMQNGEEPYVYKNFDGKNLPTLIEMLKGDSIDE